MKFERIYSVDYVNPKTNVEILPGINVSLLELLKRATYTGNNINIQDFKREKSSDKSTYFWIYTFDITLPTYIDVMDKNGVLDRQFVHIDLKGKLELVPNVIEIDSKHGNYIEVGKFYRYDVNTIIRHKDEDLEDDILYNEYLGNSEEDALGTIFKNLISNIDYWLMLGTL